jgi:hypothetical protein
MISLLRFGVSVLCVLAAVLAVESAQPAGHKKEKAMNPQSPKTSAELTKLARTYSMGAVSEQYRQSLPIPVWSNSAVDVEFFFAPAHARPQQPVDLFPPKFALTLHLDGSLIRLWKVSPRDFGLNHDAAQSIGRFGLPEGWTYENYEERHARLLESLDILLPQFAAQNSRPDGETGAAAREYLKLFKELMEPPLTPYYETLGKPFFAWVRAASQ